MMNVLDHNQRRDHLETALEAACCALVTLESIRSATGQLDADPVGIQAHVQCAIESLRDALTELRMSRSETANPLVLGFVAAAPPPPSSDRGQPRPWRTA